jgi:arabinofuranosyltransferase
MKLAADRVLIGVGLAISAVAIFVYTKQVALAWSYTPDDAFIWFRYAQNLAAGNGITFNAEGPRAEGYTGFLWLWIMAVPHWLRSDPVVFSKWVGMALAAGTFALTFRIAMELSDFADRGVRWVAAALAILLLTASLMVPAHSVSGMETILYAFLLLLLFHLEFLLRECGDPGVIRALPVVGLLVGLARPEGVLATCCVLCAALWQAPPSVRSRLFRSTLIGFVVPGAIYFAWRFNYYGVPLPLTFYVTTLTHSGTTGWEKFQDFAVAVGITTGLLFAIGGVANRRRIPGALAAIVILTLFYIVPTHRIPHQSRYFFPALPLMCAVAGSGVAALVRAVGELLGDGERGRRWAFAVLGVATATIFGVNHSKLGKDGAIEAAGGLIYYNLMFEARHVRLGKELAKISGDLDHRPSLAIGDAGAVPYYSGWHAIDSFGLNDSHIALTGDHDPQYILQQSPDLVIIRAWSAKPLNPMFDWGQEHYDACLAAGMEVIRVFGSKPYVLLVMGDPDSKIAGRLREIAAERSKKRRQRRGAPR